MKIAYILQYKSLPKVSFKKGIRGNKRKAEDNTQSRPAKVHVDLDPEVSGSLRGSRRRSARIQGKVHRYYSNIDLYGNIFVVLFY